MVIPFYPNRRKNSRDAADSAYFFKFLERQSGGPHGESPRGPPFDMGCVLAGRFSRTCLHLSWGPLCHAMARWRKVMICARVQVVPGSKVVEVVPWVTPLSTAQATASA